MSLWVTQGIFSTVDKGFSVSAVEVLEAVDSLDVVEGLETELLFSTSVRFSSWKIYSNETHLMYRTCKYESWFLKNLLN